MLMKLWITSQKFAVHFGGFVAASQYANPEHQLKRLI